MQLIWCLLSLFLTLLNCSCSQDKNATQNTIIKTTPVTVVKPHLQDVNIAESAFGKIESQFAPNISSEISGQILQIYSQIGDEVKQGQVLAVLNDENLKLHRDSTSAEVARLKTIVNLQNLQVARLTNMVQQKFIPVSNLDEAKCQLQASKEQLNSAQSQLLITEKNLEKTRIISPLDGIIEKRFVSIGDFVRTGEPLFKITSTQTLLVTLSFPHHIAEKIQVGMPVTFKISQQPDNIVQSVVDKISPNINQNTNSVDVICKLTTPYKFIKPGGQIYGEVLIAARKNVLLIPKSCLVQRPEGDLLYAIHNNKVQKRMVKLGVQKNNFIEITQGISINDTIIDDGANFLTDGSLVTVQNTA